jgi:hypothetical protein
MDVITGFIQGQIFPKDSWIFISPVMEYYDTYHPVNYTWISAIVAENR